MRAMLNKALHSYAEGRCGMRCAGRVRHLPFFRWDHENGHRARAQGAPAQCRVWGLYLLVRLNACQCMQHTAAAWEALTDAPNVQAID